MAATNDIARLIAGLAGSDPKTRATSALELYRVGADLVDASLHRFMGDPEFRSLVQTQATPTAHSKGAAVALVVGAAVLPDVFERIRGANGSPQLADVPPDQDAKEFELEFENGAAMDILTTRDTAGSGAIARYLQKFGQGIQQVEICVSNVDRATEILRARFGIAGIYPAARPGAGGTRVNFFLVPGSTGGKALLELVEPRQKIPRG